MTKRSKPRAVKSTNKIDILESGSLAEIDISKEIVKKTIEYHQAYYFELSVQRARIKDHLIEALNLSCKNSFSFTSWQRAVRWKYSLHPLCTIGSLSWAGQRFNAGKETENIMPPFPALYIAIDKDTALQETLGQEPSKDKGLTPREIALINPVSQCIVSVSGKLGSIIDIRDMANLKKFVKLIKDFTVTEHVKKLAKVISEPTPDLVTTSKTLQRGLLDKNWKTYPANYDIPANSQIFGQLAMLAGIDGILYPSKLTGKDCLAIFTTNFEQSNSFVELSDESPDVNTPKRIDAKTWRLCGLQFEEIKKIRENYNWFREFKTEPLIVRFLFGKLENKFPNGRFIF